MTWRSRRERLLGRSGSLGTAPHFVGVPRFFARFRTGFRLIRPDAKLNLRLRLRVRIGSRAVSRLS